jgi:hypothetical protein
MTTSFFISGPCSDSSYEMVRDEPACARFKDYVETLWEKYRGYEDPHFLTEAKSHFFQRYWEMYLTCALIENGFTLERDGPEGPEYFFKYKNRRVWVEAIAPEQGNGADRVPDIVTNGCSPVPITQHTLRYTSAIREKLKSFEIAIEKGIAKVDDGFIIAVNAVLFSPPYANFDAEVPTFVKACLAIGDMVVTFNRHTNEQIAPHFSVRAHVTKSNNATVSMGSLVHPSQTSICAILHSRSGLEGDANKVLGYDFQVLHNPNASLSIDASLFAWCEQFSLINDELHITPRVSV